VFGVSWVLKTEKEGRTMRKILQRGWIVLVVAFVITSSFSVSTSAAAEDPIVLKAMCFSPDTDKVVAPPYYRLIDKINGRAKGELVIEHRGGPEAIPGFDQFGALAKGVFDFGVENESYYGKQVTGLPVTHLSRLSPVEERESGYYKLRVEILQKHNVRYLGRAWGHGLGYCVYTNKLVKDPRKDFKGQKLRISPAYEPLCRALGAAPVVLPFPDIYTAMERGTIDGFIIASSIALDFSWHEVTKYFTDPPVYTINLEVLMNLDSWNRLPKHLQDLIEGCMAEFERESIPESQAYVRDYRQRMIDAGMAPLKWSPEDVEWFAKTAFDASWADTKAKIKPPELFSRIVEVSRP
jgi:TRAP-type C4-dicarboxylate transport system substrate-binding protein